MSYGRTESIGIVWYEGASIVGFFLLPDTFIIPGSTRLQASSEHQDQLIEPG